MLRCIENDENMGYVYRRYIRFAISFEKGSYIVVDNDGGGRVIVRVKWYPYSGFVKCEEEIPPEAVYAAEKLMALHDADSDAYPLNGERYLASTYGHARGTGLRIKRIKNRSETTLRTFLPLVLRFLAALLFGAAALLLQHSSLRQWIYYLFPSLGLRGILLLAVGVELLGVALMFAVFPARRSPIGLLLNAFVPVGLIAVCAMLKCYWWMWIVLPICALTAVYLSVLYTAIVEEKRWGKDIMNILRRTAVVSVIVLLSASSILGLNTYNRGTGSANAIGMSDDELRTQHKITCSKLERGVWNWLTVSEKLDVLQSICDYECREVLGCERVEVRSGMTSRDSVLGEYSNESRSFVIKEEHLKNSDAEEVLDTVLHELRHAYQHSLTEMYASLSMYIDDEYIDLYPFRQAREFAEGFEDYCSGEEDFERYYRQNVEADSRAWAEKRFKEHYIGYVYPDR